MSPNMPESRSLPNRINFIGKNIIRGVSYPSENPSTRGTEYVSKKESIEYPPCYTTSHVPKI